MHVCVATIFFCFSFRIEREYTYHSHQHTNFFLGFFVLSMHTWKALAENKTVFPSHSMRHIRSGRVSRGGIKIKLSATGTL
jgi:hypothetical protein